MTKLPPTFVTRELLRYHDSQASHARYCRDLLALWREISEDPREPYRLAYAAAVEEIEARAPRGQD